MNKEINKKKLLVCLAAILLILGCSDRETNPLLGYWDVDDKRTMSELKKSKSLVDYSKWITCYQKKACGNYSVHYSETEYFYLYPLGNGEYFKTESAGYELSRNGNYLELTKIDGTKETILKITLTDQGYYVYLEGFNEYFVKSSISDNQITMLAPKSKGRRLDKAGN